MNIDTKFNKKLQKITGFIALLIFAIFYLIERFFLSFFSEIIIFDVPLGNLFILFVMLLFILSNTKIVNTCKTSNIEKETIVKDIVKDKVKDTMKDKFKDKNKTKFFLAFIYPILILLYGFYKYYRFKNNGIYSVDYSINIFKDILIGLIIAPIIEEIFFRGILQKKLYEVTHPIFSIILVALFYTYYMVGYTKNEIIFILISAAIVGLVYYLTKSITSSILCNSLIKAFLLLINVSSYNYVLLPSLIIVFILTISLLFLSIHIEKKNLINRI